MKHRIFIAFLIIIAFGIEMSIFQLNNSFEMNTTRNSETNYSIDSNTYQLFNNPVSSKTNSLSKSNYFVPLSNLVNKNPISINGNSQISQYSSSGNGTAVNPYLITGFNITNTTVSNLIEIQNTNKYITITNCYFDGEDAGVIYGIVILYSGNIVVNNNKMEKLYSGVATNYANNTIIENNLINITQNGQGIILNNGMGIIVQSNTISVTSGVGIYPQNSVHLTIENNNVENSMGGIWFDNVLYTTAVNNNLSNFTDSAMLASYTTNLTLQSNFIYNSSIGIKDSFGIYFTAFSNLIDLSQQFGYQCLSSSYNTVQNNIFTDSVKFGVSLAHCTNNQIKNNQITGTLGASSNCISLSSSDFNTLMNNSLKDSELLLNLTLSNWNNITDNHFISSYDNETELFSSNNNVIYNCTFGPSLTPELVLTNGKGNRIKMNSFSYSTYYSLVLMSNEYADVIDQNNFFAMGNFGGSQAIDDGVNNLFQFNYWTGWSSPDRNGDGIVDYPYLIDGLAHSFDKTPLTSPKGLNYLNNQSIPTITITTTISIVNTTSVFITNVSTSSSSSSKPASSPGFTIPIFILGLMVLTGFILRKRRPNQ